MRGGRNLSGRGPGNEVALQTALFTEKGCERIMRFAFDLARTRRVKKVSSVTKSNAQQYGMVLWDETFARVARDYPDVTTESVLVDAMSAKFVLKPEDLSGVVASNLNADILSDLGSALAGSLGWPPAPTSTRSAGSRACSSRCTARPRTSPGRAWPTRSAPSCPAR
jgi:tartrate dehydrogenase/decarboxylase/D-malate dehydrogenase